MASWGSEPLLVWAASWVLQIQGVLLVHCQGNQSALQGLECVLDKRLSVLGKGVAKSQEEKTGCG